MTNDDLKNILSRKGYGIQSSLGKGIEPTLKERPLGSKAGSAGQTQNLEPTIVHEQLRSEAVSLNYTGKCRVRIKFYRHRLADYSRAISEKAIVDSCVYAGIIRDDSETEIWLVDEGQEKVATKDEERTEIIFEYSDFDFEHPFVQRTKFGNA